ncbi:23S rRNA (uracil(747)-C(5))-methyltransferase RlmC [Nocardioides sp.]|uniref:23S rRNA (uracil(747)-C(5))-methyltransferase RlmC n=1 Tax=Nocardioides sp. TaxID=35761 RepID=UPI002722DA69|nr:23S rRNA (uracil(747)-C(5))-methyltransferase RlmC [Nocardioides sp.]MDO9456419.1 23S rRNA (uracil(747)-C(5))-methyltransferase RlmC [Nocardioides sp.]
MQCGYFDAGLCRSCTHLLTPYVDQLAAKDARARAALDGHPGMAWLPPVASAEAGFRNKAKMVVAGTVEAPTLGILDTDGRGVDLRSCGLYSPTVHALLPALARLVTTAGLTPYDVPSRRGELKHVLVTESPGGELLVRWVLRSTEPLPRLRKHLPALLAEHPEVVVASANLQPEHKAVLEGDEEVLLTERTTLRVEVDGIGLHLGPRSFFQTNTAVAAALYRQAREWADEAAPASVLDLYCGVGGFALHLAAPGRRVHGVEVSEQAVASARTTASELGLVDVTFAAGDATGTAGPDADLVVVNPPRRGLGPELCATLEASAATTLVYSSCNATTLARDLAALPSWSPRRARLLDMFPHTDHYEVIVLLDRAGRADRADRAQTAAGSEK